MTRLGSSNFFEHEVPFFGVLSSDPSQNPGTLREIFSSFSVVAFVYIYGSFFEDLYSCLCCLFVDFFNWNRVMIRYCDGACFSGHPEAEFKVIRLLVG
jgi:hypothetical protein